MSREAFKCDLWWNKPRFLGGSNPVLIVADIQKFFDLHDEATLYEAVAGMVTEYGGRESDIRQYWLDLHDLATGELITRLSVSSTDLAMVRDGTRTATGMARPSLSLEDVSDEALLGELARRLRKR